MAGGRNLMKQQQVFTPVSVGLRDSTSRLTLSQPGSPTALGMAWGAAV
ncbi:unnamed protein product [Spirodela intermedia]|uniref:Uncharacterized protein n=2 Tax=Spirodela intermedia TaxID=51605 RepID=A0A7I8K7W3_SPIIN|nr:unnamed protein product [Spirodela intermedia]CAA6656882.1 unnamed protein product [Spirodela intermedia]CAA7392840.1 unnamed protein product [Spirodela intermedia]